MKKCNSYDDYSSFGRKWIREQLEQQLGFRLSELSSFSSFVRLLHKPSDPASLAAVRILFGLLMVVDVHHERGLAIADLRWGDPEECRFPFFNFLKPFPLEWMCIIYLLMLIGAVGIVCGAFFRLSCACFLIPYWYIFFLDKSRWNNHSYLFGLLSLHLMVSGANRCWSVDGRMNPEIKNANVPLWNYLLLRGQVFLVYFIAGLKKTDGEWVGGYSMDNLALHWVFDGFRLFLADHQIDYFIVHLGGFFLDLTVGFLMLLDSTRPLAFFFCTSFNLMNSRIFAIGMFPYVMIAVMPVFCYPDWPRVILSYFPQRLQKAVLYDSPPRKSTDCIYESSGDEGKVLDNKEDSIENNDQNTLSSQDDIKPSQKMAALGICTYFAIQAFLPYSHWVTKGYNTWTLGLYGYSWDMMVHNWRYMHTKVMIVDKRTRQHFYLDPEAWTQSWRWTHHADMVKQFAHCAQQRLATKHNVTEIEVYVDVWISLNRRFTQRVYDPTIDILAADWSPFREVTWVLPLLVDLSDWRQRLLAMEERLFRESESLDVVFVTDFPGLHLVNYVDEDLGNTTIEVLKGDVEVVLNLGEVTTLSKGQSMKIPAGDFHTVTPLHHSPACYMYLYINTTHVNLEHAWQEAADNYKEISCPSCDAEDRKSKFFQMKKKQSEKKEISFWTRFSASLVEKYKIWKRSVFLLSRALYSIWTKTPMPVNRTHIDL